MAVSQLALVFKLDKTGFNLRRGMAVVVVGLIPLIVLSAIGQDKYFVSMIFAVLFLGGVTRAASSATGCRTWRCSP